MVPSVPASGGSYNIHLLLWPILASNVPREGQLILVLHDVFLKFGQLYLSRVTECISPVYTYFYCWSLHCNDTKLLPSVCLQTSSVLYPMAKVEVHFKKSIINHPPYEKMNDHQ